MRRLTLCLTAVSPAPALEFAEVAGAEVVELQNDCGHTALFCAPEP